MHVTTSLDPIPGLHQFVDITGTPTRTLYADSTFLGFDTTTTPTNANIGDLWHHGDALLVWNASAWVTGDSPLLPSIPAYGHANGIWVMNEKITSTISRNVRFFLPPLPETIMLRVTSQRSPRPTTTENPPSR